MISMIIRTLFGYLVFGIVCGLVFFPMLFCVLLPERWRYNRFYFWLSSIFYRSIVWASFLPITVEGRENILSEPVIFAANHQSSLDIPVIGSLLSSRPHVWLFLNRYSKVPFFGFIVRRMNIPVDISGVRKAVSSIWHAIDRVRGTNRDVIIFPEGGRSQTNQVKDFFYGFAVIAKETKRPVIPVMLYNLGSVYPPGSFLVHMCQIKVVIGKPFYFKPDETDDQFVDRVHQWFVVQSRREVPC